MSQRPVQEFPAVQDQKQRKIEEKPVSSSLGIQSKIFDIILIVPTDVVGVDQEFHHQHNTELHWESHGLWSLSSPKICQYSENV